LGDVCSDISYGYTESASLVPIGPKFLRITDIVPGRVNWETVPYCKISDADISRYKLLAGDIVIARTGATTGYTYTIKPSDLKNDAVFASYLIRYRPNKLHADPFFVGQILTSPIWKGFVEGILSGSAQPGANAKQFANFEFILPPLPEQRAIAGVLSSLDDKIDLLHRQNKTLEGMAEAVFREKFVVNSGKWPASLLSKHIEVYRGLSYKGSGLCSEGEGVPMHNLNSILEGGGYKYTGIKYYKGDFKDRHEIKPGTVIVANTEQGHKLLLIGYPAIIPKLIGNNGIFSQHLFKLEIKSGSPLSNVFLYYLLKSQKTWEQVIGATNGSTVNMLATVGLENVEFNMPPSKLIDSFTEFAKYTLDKQEQNISSTRILTRLRNALLPKLMSGELRVTL
jgi:type I restriction enzyme S subunit